MVGLLSNAIGGSTEGAELLSSLDSECGFLVVIDSGGLLEASGAEVSAWTGNETCRSDFELARSRALTVSEGGF